MKKALEKGPAQRSGLKNKYLPLITIVGFLLFSTCAHAQFYDSTKLLQYIQAYGYSWKNAEFRGPVILAKDTPKLAVKDSGALVYKHGVYYGNNGYGYFPISNGWNIKGNSGTNSAINFLGTTDNQNLVIKTNNISRAIFNTSGTFMMNAPSASMELNNNSSSDTYFSLGPTDHKFVKFHNNSSPGYFKIEKYSILDNYTTYPLIATSTGNISLGSDDTYPTRGISIITLGGSAGLVSNTPYLSGLGSGGSLNIGANTSGNGGIVRMVSRNSGGFRSILEFADNTATITSDLLLQKSGGNVGIGTSSPTDELHVVGDFKLVNGSQGLGKVLVSGATGITTFQSGFVKNLVTNTTQIGNIGSGQDNLMTYIMPANTLSSNGDYIEFEMFFFFQSNANSKEVIIYLGTDDFYTTGAQNQNDGHLMIKGKIVRFSSTSQIITIEQTVSQGSLFSTRSEYAGGGQDLTTPITIKATGAGIANNDINQILMSIKYVPAN